MRSCFVVGCVMAIAVILAACAKNAVETGEVSGVVKLGGRPLAEATVQFIPEQGRMSMATTDESGHYDLAYSGTRMGALVGRHKVRISTWRAPDGDRNLPGAPERVPMKYNAASELTGEVKPGPNEINFDLETKGRIQQIH
ncbi:MAG TPA: carboxypeptidase-like regulatory domain-containing protein [Caulifigura sp.]|nr:carboxypeptidase-like regulatory domain-containing protein [Caulifigura sp.]